VLPYLREALRTGEPDSVSNAAAAMIMLGQLEDIPLLRVVHRQFKADMEIRAGIATHPGYLGETDEAALERELDDIQAACLSRSMGRHLGAARALVWLRSLPALLSPSATLILSRNSRLGPHVAAMDTNIAATLRRSIL